MEICPFDDCKKECFNNKSLSYHMSMKHLISLHDYEIEKFGIKCKICPNIIHSSRVYCSNSCKFKDEEYREYRKNRSSEALKLKEQLWKCKYCDFISDSNVGGALSQHKNHNCIQIAIIKVNENNVKEYFDILDKKEYLNSIKKEFNYTCKICTKDFSADSIETLKESFGTHLGSFHHIDTVDYINEYDKEKENIFLRAGEIEKLKLIEQYGIECPLCNIKLLHINNKHLNLKHNITIEEFKIRFPRAQITSQHTNKLKSENIDKVNANFIWKKSYKSEERFRNILIHSNIDFLEQKYEGVNRINRWDFIIEKFNCIVEIDGIFHIPIKDSTIFYNRITNDYEKNKEAILIKRKIFRILDNKTRELENFIIRDIKDLEDISYYYQDEYGNVIKQSPYLDIIQDINNIFMTKEKLLKSKLKNTDYERQVIMNYAPSILEYVRAFFPQFPYKQQLMTREIINDHINTFSNTKLEKYIDIEDKIIKNYNNFGCKELKHHFANFYNCKRNNCKSVIEMFENDKDMMESIIYRCGVNNSKMYSYTLRNGDIINTKETFDISVKNIIRGLIVKQKSVSFFKPNLASMVYKLFLKEYEDKFDKLYIYDPSMGFGSRYLSSKVVNNSYYIGTDPDTETFKNNQLLVKTLEDTNVEMYSEKSENLELNKDINFSFTCPPYWNTETYDYDIAENYKTYENWLDKYVRKTAINIYSKLNLDPQLCILVVSNKLSNDFIKIYEQVGFKLKDVFVISSQGSHFSKIKKTHEEKLLIFHKPTI